MWVGAPSLAWGGENGWLFPPAPLVGLWAPTPTPASLGASATLICPTAPWAPPRYSLRDGAPTLRHGAGWARDVRRVVPLGPPAEALDVSRRDLRPFGGGHVIAVSFGRS
jgi:hypothetical protein